MTRVPPLLVFRETRPDQAECSPSGPLHDAAEVCRAGVPTVMLFVQSLRGISHNQIEDTREDHIEMSVRALDALARRATAWLAASQP